MANTADIIGEQETLDKLVAHTLEDFEDDRITRVRNHAFDFNDELKSINLPNVTAVGDYAFNDCYNLENAIFSNKITNIGSYCFDSCYKLNNISDFSNVKTLPNYSFNACCCLNNIDLSNIIQIYSYALQHCGIGTVVLPKCTNLYEYISNGVRISTIDLYKLVASSINSFRDSYSLSHLILRSDSLCVLNSTSAFINTPIAEGLGWIYVPTDLVDTYKTATNWSTYANRIVSIDEYPKALDGETITDTWDEIFQAENNDTYKTKYSVGDTKYLVIGGTYVLMQIIAFDRDILSSDGTSTAKITWLSKSLSFQLPINLTTSHTGGWAECECRKILNDIIYEQFPESVKNRILPVNKTYSATSSPSGTTVISDKLWIPSSREMVGDDAYENSGIDYTDYFNSDDRRKKSLGLSLYFNTWALRSIYNSSIRMIGSSGGTNASGSITGFYNLAIGFCT